MTDEKDIAQPPTAQRDMPVHCSKCDVFNERAASVCISCGAHLRLKCKKCGAANLRTASRCNRCHQRMRAPSFVLPRWNRPFSNLMKKTQWHPTGAWSLSEPVEFANDPLALRQNEFKDFVILSAL